MPAIKPQNANTTNINPSVQMQCVDIRLGSCFLHSQQLFLGCIEKSFGPTKTFEVLQIYFAVFVSGWLVHRTTESICAPILFSVYTLLALPDLFAVGT